MREESSAGGIVMPNGNCTSTLNIIGGRINKQGYGTSCSFTRNLYFDRRFASNNFAPPWFPSTTIQVGGAQPINIDSAMQRIRWTNQTVFQ